jgi:hypothetical protein
MDDAFLSLWLRLREPADTSARSAELTKAVATRLPRDQPVQVLDLATGAGSNLRYLVGHLPPRQRWLVVDRSAALLSALVERTTAWGTGRGFEVRGDGSRFTLQGQRLDCHVETRLRDLDSLEDAELFAGRHLVAASALLDLVSSSWLRTLASRCRDSGAVALFTITYDGRFSCTPAEPEDELVRGLVNEYQGRDKGLGGPAEGRRGAACAERCFEEAGYRVLSESSDWMLGSAEAPLQRSLIEGWAEAAAEMAPHLSETIARWRGRRLAHVGTRRSHVEVGHRDLAAWPK